MIKTYEMLKEELPNYKNPKTKIQRMVKNKQIFPITKGLYETNEHVNPFYLANPIYSPSYISFETALAYYDLIPERVYMIKNATFKKRKKKRFETKFGIYTYQDVPPKAFPYGKEMIEVDGYMYLIAKKEKALLDLLYDTKPIKTMKEMREYLFENMRINELILDTFDKQLCSDLKNLYHSRNVDLFVNMLLKGRLYD